jgi:hypothetical protein
MAQSLEDRIAQVASQQAGRRGGGNAAPSGGGGVGGKTLQERVATVAAGGGPTDNASAHHEAFPGADLLQGAGAGALSTIYHGGDLIRRGLGMKRVINEPDVQKGITPPPSWMGKAGFLGEQIGEVALTPEASESTFLKLGKGSKLAAGALKAVQEGARMGATEYVQTGGDARAAATAALTAGGITGLGEALKPVLSSVGRKIQMGTIRPRAVDLRDGFKWSTLDRFKLKGNLEQSYQQVDTELTRLRTARNAMLAPGAANVDIGAAMRDAQKELSTQVADLKHAGTSKQVIAQFKKLSGDIMKAAGSGTVDIRLAENAKESIGLLGSWAQGLPDKDAQAIEKAANEIYFQLKTKIEQSVGPQGAQVKILNKKMQDLIPVKRAMLARIPVEDRNRMLSLADLAALLPAMLSGNPLEAGGLALTRGQKSLRVGNALVRHGGTPLAQPIGRVAAEVSTRDTGSDNDQ